MNEEVVSTALYRAGVEDPQIEVLSWQSVDGKGYFASDVKLRGADGRRFEPDLILRLDRWVWLIEVKGKHSEALSDEAKLVGLLEDLGEKEILEQIRLRSEIDVGDLRVVLAVAFFGNDVAASPQVEEGSQDPCGDGVLHIDWEVMEAEAVAGGLGGSLRALYAAQHRST